MSKERSSASADAVAVRAPAQQHAKRLFLWPTVILILLLSIFPLIFSLVVSFLSWDLSRLQGGIRFAGLANFITLVKDGRFWNTTRVTVFFVAGAVALEYVLGLGIALLLNQITRLRRMFVVIFLMPMMLTPAAVGYVGRMLFNEGKGPINDIIQHLGGPMVPWISKGAFALPSLILVDAWEWTPFMMIVLFAGLQSLPVELFEAARVDGASGFQIFRYITFPMLIPVSLSVVMIRGLEAFKLFDIAAVMTGGGPGTATETVTMYAYQVAMKNGNLGYASAIAYSLLIMIVIFSTIFLNSLRKRTAAITE